MRVGWGVIWFADPLVAVIGRFSEGVVRSGDRVVEPLAIGVAWIRVSKFRAVIHRIRY